MFLFRNKSRTSLTNPVSAPIIFNENPSFGEIVRFNGKPAIVKIVKTILGVFVIYQ